MVKDQRFDHAWSPLALWGSWGSMARERGADSRVAQLWGVARGFAGHVTAFLDLKCSTQMMLSSPDQKCRKKCVTASTSEDSLRQRPPNITSWNLMKLALSCCGLMHEVMTNHDKTQDISSCAVFSKPNLLVNSHLVRRRCCVGSRAVSSFNVFHWRYPLMTCTWAELKHGKKEQGATRSSRSCGDAVPLWLILYSVFWRTVFTRSLPVVLALAQLGESFSAMNLQWTACIQYQAFWFKRLAHMRSCTRRHSHTILLAYIGGFCG